MSAFDIICDNSNKDLEEIPENVLRMYNLKMLYLEGNLLETLPENIFERLSRLTWLDLRNNRLTTIPTGIANHPSLETLLLQDNNIEKLPNELGLVPNLKVLQISGNPLKYPKYDIIDGGVHSVCKFLKDEYEKEHKPSNAEDEEEREIAVIERKSSSNVVKAEEKISVHELLRRSAQQINYRGQSVMPVIDVKSLSKYNPEDVSTEKKTANIYTIRPNPAKRAHKITRSCSKVCLKSHSQWNCKKQSDEAERVHSEELKEIWLNRLRELLADQEKILQQEKNLKALSKWRLDKKMELPRDDIQEIFDPPFGTDPEALKMLTRKDLADLTDNMNRRVTRRVVSSKKIDMQRLINDVVDQMKNLEGRCSSATSPRTEQEIAAKQIESIVELHKKIMALQITNANNY